MTKNCYTFGVIGKVHGNYGYCREIGNYVTEKSQREAILEIASFIHRAPCDVFIDAINDIYLEKPYGLYGALTSDGEF